MQSYDFPLYPIVGCFAFGCILSHQMDVNPQEIMVFLATSIVSTACFLFIAAQRYKMVKSVLLYSLFIGLGWLRFASYYQIPKTHFSHHLSENPLSFTLKIDQFVGENDFSRSYYASMISVGTQTANGNLIVYQPKEHTHKWKHGTRITTAITPQPLSKPRNPGAFDYGKYLQNIRIDHQIQLKKGRYVVLPSQAEDFWNVLENVQNKCFQKVEKSGLSRQFVALLKALILGNRKTLDRDLIGAYANAGVIHLLAISGLHIGIITLFLLTLLKPLSAFKRGLVVRSVLIVTILWGFALFTGLSASVVRAVTLFSLLTVATAFKRSKNSLLLLVTAFLILLVSYPPYLKQVGFQMSFLAVFGILWIRPVFARYWTPRHRLLKWFWDLTTVCLAAQIAVAPLSVYYFHQFPGLFLIANWMILPFFSGFLIACIFIMGWTLLFSLPPWLVVAFDAVVFAMNSLVGWIAAQEQFIFKNLNISIENLLLFYALLFCLVLFLKKPSRTKLQYALVSLLLLQGVRFKELLEKSNTNNLWILHQHDATFLLHHKNDSVYYFSPKKSFDSSKVYADFKNEKAFTQVDSMAIKNYWEYQNIRLLIVESDALLLIKNIQPSHILLRENPKINLARLLEFYNPQMIISDGSNAPWMIPQWKKTCKEQHVSFYDTRTNGALCISL